MLEDQILRLRSGQGPGKFWFDWKEDSDYCLVRKSACLAVLRAVQLQSGEENLLKRRAKMAEDTGSLTKVCLTYRPACVLPGRLWSWFLKV